VYCVQYFCAVFLVEYLMTTEIAQNDHHGGPHIPDCAVSSSTRESRTPYKTV
jgi:hypothetical protein